MFCKKCGKEILDAEKICSFCGEASEFEAQKAEPVEEAKTAEEKCANAFKTEGATTPEPPVVEQNAEALSEETSVMEPPAPQKSQKNTKLIIIILAIVAVVITVVVGLLFVSGGDDTSNDEDLALSSESETTEENEIETEETDSDSGVVGFWEYVGTMDSETGEDIPSPETYVESCRLDSDYTGKITIITSGQSFSYDITWESSDLKGESGSQVYNAYTDDGTEIGISYMPSSDALMFLVNEDYALLQRGEETETESGNVASLDGSSILGNWEYNAAIDSTTAAITSTPDTYITDMTFLSDNSAMLILFSTDTYDTTVVDDAKWNYVRTDSEGNLVYNLSASSSTFTLYLGTDGKSLVMLGSEISLGYSRK